MEIWCRIEKKHDCSEVTLTMEPRVLSTEKIDQNESKLSLSTLN